ncbi:MAG: DUF29 domain-containing protein [Synechococcaceae cyanobacterium SM2_3_2]|nr:DUF29 domain-containing protein [Synechococcaceae cyanobacterium SM2_3_2]
MSTGLYDQDFLSWTEQQVRLLGSQRWDELDIANLIEEVSSLGKQQRQEFRNRVAVLLCHLLKWQYQPKRRGRSWALTIEEQRLQVKDLLLDNPSLKGSLDDLIPASYERGILQAAKETNLDKATFPTTCPYSFDQIMDPNFLPEGFKP